MKKHFIVEIPLNARVSMVVEAENEKEAIEITLKDCDLQLNPKSKKGYTIEEWNIYEKLLEGNVWHGIIYEATVEKDEF